MANTEDETTKRGNGADRRSVLKVVGGGLAAAASLPAVTSAQQDPDYRLGGEAAAWHGRAPSSIEGQTNPTLDLEPGQTYVLVWENMDGLPHNFVTLDAEGNAITSSELISEEGATQTVEFEATQEMTEYYCEVHPTRMRGQIDTSGGGGGTQNGTTGNATTTGPGTTTETATPTETATETVTETDAATETDAGGGATTTETSGPGFGIGSVAAALGVGALVEKLRRD